MSIALLQAYMDEYGLNQVQVAAQLGKSTAVVNQYLQGKYHGNTDKLDRAVEQLIERQHSKRLDVNTGFISTPTARRIIETCALAHAMIDIHIVVGEAGLGKTMALREYAEQQANVILIEVDPTYTAKVLLQTLCDKLGLTCGKTNHAMMDAICQKLRGSERLLIVDEAELLRHQPLEILRRIHDKAGIGIVLAGMPRLRANLRGARGEYRQLYSRVGMQLDLKTRLPDEDIAALAEAGLGTDAFNSRLNEISGGNARRLNKLLRGVLRLSELHAEPVNTAMIEQFADMLID